MIVEGMLQGIAGFVAYAAVVALLLRVRLVPTAVVIGTVPAAWALALAALLVAGYGVNFWVFSTSYSFFVLCFLMAFGATYKSISLRIVLDLWQRPGRAENSAALSRRILDESFRNRLAIIEEKRYAVREGSAYALTERGARIAGWAYATQTLFRITRSG